MNWFYKNEEYSDHSKYKIRLYNILESENSWNRKHNFRKLPKLITEKYMKNMKKS